MRELILFISHDYSPKAAAPPIVVSRTTLIFARARESAVLNVPSFQPNSRARSASVTLSNADALAVNAIRSLSPKPTKNLSASLTSRYVAGVTVPSTWFASVVESNPVLSGSEVADECCGGMGSCVVPCLVLGRPHSNTSRSFCLFVLDLREKSIVLFLAIFSSHVPNRPFASRSKFSLAFQAFRKASCTTSSASWRLYSTRFTRRKSHWACALCSASNARWSPRLNRWISSSSFSRDRMACSMSASPSIVDLQLKSAASHRVPVCHPRAAASTRFLQDTRSRVTSHVRLPPRRKKFRHLDVTRPRVLL